MLFAVENNEKTTITDTKTTMKQTLNRQFIFLFVKFRTADVVVFIVVNDLSLSQAKMTLWLYTRRTH